MNKRAKSDRKLQTGWGEPSSPLLSLLNLRDGRWFDPTSLTVEMTVEITKSGDDCGDD